MENGRQMPTVGFITLGCAKNEVDTDHMSALLAAAGFGLLRGQLLGNLDADEHDEAATVVQGSDVVVVNTCSFLTSATEEAVDTILDVLGQHAFVPGKTKLVVTGCMPSRYGAELSTELPEVDAFVPVDAEEDIVAIMRRVCGLAPVTPSDASADAGSGADSGAATGSDAAAESGTESGAAAESGAIAGFAGSSSADAVTLRRITEEPWAYVKISDGCDRYCSFCTIPFIRGRYASRTAADIDAEIGELVNRGVCEIVLIGQDTGIWGEDLSAPVAGDAACAEPRNLAQLLGWLAERHPDTWLRVMYLQPEGITDELLDMMATHDNVCDYLDIPLQHADERIVADMNRTGDGAEYLETLARIRDRLPDVALRSTFIAGFPGETEDQFDELVDFIDEAAFDYAVVFPYSTEDGTVAGERPDQVDEDVREQRARELLDHAEEIGHARCAARVGTSSTVLVCGFDAEQGMWYGRTQAQAPDVDGVVYVEGAKDIRKGMRVRVTMNASMGFELEGTVR